MDGRLGAFRLPRLLSGSRAKDPPMLRTTVAAVATLALSTFALVGCPGPNPSNYCDSTGCYECDGYGCHPANPTVDGGADGGTCTSKADCTPGNDCVGGSCKPAARPSTCSTKADCKSTEACVDGTCTAVQNSCTSASECGDGRLCADGQCVASCTNGSCDSGFSCKSGVCIPDVGASCSSDAQCTAAAPVCAGGHCKAQCSIDSECGSGKYCNQGVCSPDTRPKPNCASDNDCGGSGAPRTCRDGYCRFTCAADAYCRTVDARFAACKEGVCRTSSEAAPECTGAGECIGGKLCVNNACR